jgi:cell wall-associated NlpC family hydrolase
VDEKEKDSITSADSLQAYANADSLLADSVLRDRTISGFFSGKEIDTKNVSPGAVVQFAKSLIGTPYRYASSDPGEGFDCSGFITYVFQHFNILVPRSSIDFTEVGNEIELAGAVPGDLVLFTGTDSTERFVGHMGLVVSNQKGVVNFIHSTSGKAYGVTITPMNSYYMGRYIKTIRIFSKDS